MGEIRNVNCFYVILDVICIRYPLVPRVCWHPFVTWMKRSSQMEPPVQLNCTTLFKQFCHVAQGTMYWNRIENVKLV